MTTPPTPEPFRPVAPLTLREMVECCVSDPEDEIDDRLEDGDRGAVRGLREAVRRLRETLESEQATEPPGPPAPAAPTAPSGLAADAVTVEYDFLDGRDTIMVVPFPDTDPDDGRTVRIFGTVEELRGVVDTMSSLLDSLED